MPWSLASASHPIPLAHSYNQTWHAETHPHVRSPPRLVCNNLPEGLVLPYLDFPSPSNKGRTYQYKVLPFGLSLSLCIFTKVTEAILALNYLDAWLDDYS